MIYIDFRDEYLINVVDKMISGLLPYSEVKEKQIKEDLDTYVRDIINLGKIESNLAIKEELEEELVITLENKRKEINDRLSYYTKFSKLEVLTNNIEKEVDRLFEIVVGDKLKLSDKLFSKIVRYIEIEEFPMEYHVIMLILGKIAEIDRANRLDGFSSKTILTREKLESILENNLENLVLTKTNELKIKEYMEEEGLDTNFNLDTTIDLAINYLYNRTINKYEEILREGFSVDESIGLEFELKEALKQVMARSTLQAASYILNDKLYVGKKLYRGSDDFFKYTEMASKEVEQRLEAEDLEGPLRLSDLVSVDEMMEKAVPKDITDWGIEPLDASYKIMTHSLNVMVAMEGTGKTQTACYSTARILMAGGKVLYISTESTKPKILSQILSAYIFLKFGKKIPYRAILEAHKLPEPMQKIIKMVKTELGLEDRLIIEQYINYKDFSNKCIQYKEDEGIDLVVLDHCGMLTRDDSNKPLSVYLTDLSEDCTKLKNKYGISFLILSHPSADAKTDMKKYGSIQDGTTTTRDCSALSRDADLVMFLSKDEDDEKKEFINMQVVKVRGIPLSNNILSLRTDFDISYISYDPKDQVSLDTTNDTEEYVEQLEEQLRNRTL